ncbi:MAG: GAP family protein [Rhodococcus sp. (in: high G+C Gram-positive bacteria)]
MSAEFVGIVVTLGGSYAILTALQVHEKRTPPLWIPFLNIVIGLVLIAGAWFVHTRERAHLRAMSHASGPSDIADAAPQLPKMLQSVEQFSVPRSALLGFALFVLNPVDVSCALAAALTLRIDTASPTEQAVAALVFVLIGASSVIGPVAMLLIRREKAAGPLGALRNWIATNTKLLNIGLLLFIAAMQISKGVQGL